MKDIAQACGVSVALVSRIINDDPTLRCRQETRDRVLKKIEDTFYIPDHNARVLANGFRKSKKDVRIGYVSYKGASKITNPYFDKIIEGITTILAEQEYSVSSFYIDDVVSACQRREPLSEKIFDGLILFGSVPSKIVSYLRDQTRYLSSVYGAEIPGADFVGSDIFMTMNYAVDYAKKLGYDKLGLILGNDKKREEALMRYIGSVGMTVDSDFCFAAGNDYASAYEQTMQKLRAGILPEIICAMNDEMAIGAMDAVFECGYSVPEDVSIIGHDDIARSSYSRVPLTTVRIFKKEIGRLVSDLLLERINYRRKFAVRVMVPCELIQRKSTRKKETTL